MYDIVLSVLIEIGGEELSAPRGETVERSASPYGHLTFNQKQCKGTAFLRPVQFLKIVKNRSF